MPLFGSFKNISQTASLGETNFSLIACLHVWLYFLPLFTLKDRERRERERRINLVEEDIPSKMEEESNCSSPSSLWEVIVNNDDICFTHVLPRLNRTDLKFLYGVNTETRKLVKRSSRKGDLKKEFKIEEMSSISTLEFAWENKSLWPRWWGDETYFCYQVAQTNKLELLK